MKKPKRESLIIGIALIAIGVTGCVLLGVGLIPYAWWHFVSPDRYAVSNTAPLCDSYSMRVEESGELHTIQIYGDGEFLAFGGAKYDLLLKGRWFAVDSAGVQFCNELGTEIGKGIVDSGGIEAVIQGLPKGYYQR